MKLLKNNIINTLISKFLTAFCLMGVVIITSQTLGSEGRGLISYVLLIIAIAQVISEFVGGSALINLAPRIRTINLIWPSYLFTILIVGILYLVMRFSGNNFIPAWLTALIALFLCLSNINLNIILGRQRINQRNGIQFLYTLLLLSGVYYVYWIQKGTDVVPYFNILAFAYIIGFILSLLQLLSLADKGSIEPLQLSRDIFKFGFWSQLAQLVNLLNYRIAYFFVERDFGLEQLGVYGNSMTVGDMMKIPGQSLGQVQHNRIINHSQPERFGLKLTKRYLTLNLVLYLLQAIVIILLPALFWTWLLGSDFITLKNVVLYLLPGFIALGLATSFSYYFHALNRFKTVLAVNLATLITFVVSYVLLVGNLGFKAVLISFSLAYVVQLMLFVVLFFRKDKGSYHPLKDIKYWWRIQFSKE
jgi:O-antigen/teichoic acid export membrane protein